MKLLFLCKTNDEYSLRALEHCKSRFEEVVAFKGDWGEKLPEECLAWRGDLIISYLSRWIIPDTMIANASLAAINFHAGSPNYPGYGPINFALYENATEYGSTCHFMLPKVDTGPIIDTEKIPVLPGDDVEALLARTYVAQYTLFERVIDRLLTEKELSPNGEQWARRPFTRKELNQMMIIEPDMSKDEVGKRIRAGTFRQFKPYVEIHGYRFELAG